MDVAQYSYDGAALFGEASVPKGVCREALDSGCASSRRYLYIGGPADVDGGLCLQTGLVAVSQRRVRSGAGGASATYSLFGGAAARGDGAGGREEGTGRGAKTGAGAEAGP